MVWRGVAAVVLRHCTGVNEGLVLSRNILSVSAVHCAFITGSWTDTGVSRQTLENPPLPQGREGVGVTLSYILEWSEQSVAEHQCCVLTNVFFISS